VRPLRIADLKAHPKNYNVHPPEQLDQLVKSVRRHGPYRNAVVSADGYILAGHGILQAARAEGYTDWPCEVRPYSHDAPDALNLLLTDNEIGNPANPSGPEPDTALLAALAQQVSEATGLDGTGMDDARLAELLAAVEPKPPLEDPGPGDPPPDPVTRPGDVWLCGAHRVVCGDSTDAAIWPERVSLVLADPPYGMRLDTDYTKMPNDKVKSRSYDPVVGDDEDFDFVPYSALASKEQLWFGADYYCQQLPSGGSWLVWDKRVEANDDALGSGFELCWSKQPHRRRMLRHNWCGYTAHDPGESRTHPTQKPIRLIAELVENHSKGGDVVFDPFLGSGTTLVACEQTGRRCYGVEIEPRYVDVAVLRWQRAVRKRAILESTGEPFPLFEEVNAGD
jgi:hypothetical protein